MTEVWPSARCSLVVSKAVVVWASRASNMFRILLMARIASAFVPPGAPARSTLLAMTSACSRSSNSLVTSKVTSLET